MDFGCTPGSHTLVLQMAGPTRNVWIGAFYFRQETTSDLVTVVGKKAVGWSLAGLCLRITPEAGFVKTGAPVGRQVMEQGLQEMIRCLPDGPAFSP